MWQQGKLHTAPKRNTSLSASTRTVSISSGYSTLTISILLLLLVQTLQYYTFISKRGKTAAPLRKAHDTISSESIFKVCI